MTGDMVLKIITAVVAKRLVEVTGTTMTISLLSSEGIRNPGAEF